MAFQQLPLLPACLVSSPHILFSQTPCLIWVELFHVEERDGSQAALVWLEEGLLQIPLKHHSWVGGGGGAVGEQEGNEEKFIKGSTFLLGMHIAHHLLF